MLLVHVVPSKPTTLHYLAHLIYATPFRGWEMVIVLYCGLKLSCPIHVVDLLLRWCATFKKRIHATDPINEARITWAPRAIAIGSHLSGEPSRFGANPAEGTRGFPSCSTVFRVFGYLDRWVGSRCLVRWRSVDALQRFLKTHGTPTQYALSTY